MRIDLRKIWNKLDGCQYLILRNHENMLTEVENGGDIDILCDSRDLIIERLKLTPRLDEYNFNNCKTIVDGIEVPIDVRYIGDGYYDAKWESDMLNRKSRKDGYYILSGCDEKYTLLYHVLIHKINVPEKYNQFLKDNFLNSNLNYLIDELAKYMLKNNYHPVMPRDKGVNFNTRNYECLIDKISKMNVLNEEIIH